MLPAKGDVRTGFLEEGASAILKDRLDLPAAAVHVYKDIKL